MGSVVLVIGVMLLLLKFLDTPFGSGVGSLQPIAMERALRITDEALAAVGDTVTPALRRRGEGPLAAVAASLAPRATKDARRCGASRP